MSQARRRRAHWNAKSRCGFAEPQLFERVEDDDGPQRPIETVDEPLAHPPHLVRGGDRLWRQCVCLFRHLIAEDLRATSVRATGVPRLPHRHPEKKTSFGAGPYVVDPPSGRDERPLNLIVNVARRNTEREKRAPHKRGMIVDERAYAHLSVALTTAGVDGQAPT